jgi:hypothetical protein
MEGQSFEDISLGRSGAHTNPRSRPNTPGRSGRALSKDFFVFVSCISWSSCAMLKLVKINKAITISHPTLFDIFINLFSEFKATKIIHFGAV